MPRFDELYEVRIGFTPAESWGGGEDGDGGDMTGSARRRTQSFLADRSSPLSGANLRALAVEFTTPEDLCIAVETLEALGDSELEEGDLTAELPKRRNGVRKPARGPRVRVNGQPLEDFLAGKPNGAPIVLRGRQSNGQRPQSGKRRRRGRRGHGNGNPGNGRR